MARIELIALANSVLRAMPERRREILRRYYFLGEPWARVCEALDITSTVFRLEQSRARAQLLERLVSATKPRKRALTTKTVPT
jgi:DNA-directed RNA polymerase specialized sigma24 family protein